MRGSATQKSRNSLIDCSEMSFLVETTQKADVQLGSHLQELSKCLHILFVIGYQEPEMKLEKKL